MGKEIERKFLVAGEGWRVAATRTMRLTQAYLAATDAASVRVRIVDGHSAVITIKSAEPGTTRDEFEYAIPLQDAQRLVALRTGEAVEKIRHVIDCEGGDLTVDEFLGANAGLVTAEIELKDADSAPPLPDWIGREVTDDRRYYNASLAFAPYRGWPENAGIAGGGPDRTD